MLKIEESMKDLILTNNSLHFMKLRKNKDLELIRKKANEMKK